MKRPDDYCEPTGIDPYEDDLECDEPDWFGMAIIYVMMVVCSIIGFIAGGWKNGKKKA